MADIELVIKISEEDYESIKDDVNKFLSMPSHKVPILYKAVNEGTPLPKGHGRIWYEANYKDRREKRKVTEEMNAMLLSLLPFLNSEMATVVKRALYLLGEIEIEPQESEG